MHTNFAIKAIIKFAIIFTNYSPISYHLVGTGLLAIFVIPSIIQPAYATLTSNQVQNIAKTVTVTIETPKLRGSGVLISSNGNVYTVLTAYHVVKSWRIKQIKVVTPDGERHSIVASSISICKPDSLTNGQLCPLDERFDLAVIQFRSQRQYAVVDVVHSQMAKLGKTVYVSGFPMAKGNPRFTFLEGKVNTLTQQPTSNGYQLFYTNPTQNGMSGGAVLNEDGKLIGIHGQADSVDGREYTRTGRNGAIPSALFIPLLENSGILQPFIPTIESVRRAESLFASASAKLQRGGTQGVMDDLNEAIRLKPDYAEAYSIRGYVRLGAGDKQGGMTDLNEAIRLKPDYAEAYSIRGFARVTSGDHPRGMNDLNEAIRLKPDYVQGYMMRGMAKVGLRDKHGGLDDLRRGAELARQQYGDEAYQQILRMIDLISEKL